MPISSPSYFPPQRNSDRIVGLNAGTTQTGNYVFLAGQEAGLDSTSSGLIIIGHLSGNGTIVNAPNTIIIGVQSGQQITQSNTSGYSAADAGIIIGYNSLNKTSSVNGSVVIGSNNFGQLSPAGSSSNYQGINNSIVIGSAIMNGAHATANPSAPITSSVIIGYGFNPNNTYWGGASNCVLIGSGICANHYSNQFSSAVVIGSGACPQGVGSNVIAIGAGCYANDFDGLAAYGIAIGSNAAPNVNGYANSGTYIGRNAGQNWSATKPWIIIGTPLNATYKCDSYIAALPNPQGDGACNVALGGATATNSNLDTADARNIVCLYNGTVGTANPTGGGYFYVTGGALHWVGSNGTDTEIAPA